MHVFEYAVLRVVPRVEREEFLNGDPPLGEAGAGDPDQLAPEAVAPVPPPAPATPPALCA